MKKYFLILPALLGILLTSGASFAMDSESEDKGFIPLDKPTLPDRDAADYGDKLLKAYQSGAPDLEKRIEQIRETEKQRIEQIRETEKQTNLVKATEQKSVDTQGLEIENYYSGPITIAFRMTGLSTPYPEDKIICKNPTTYNTKVSILPFLKEARDRVKSSPGHDHGFWFVTYTDMKEWRASIHLEKKERDDRWLCLGNKTDEELEDLDNSFILKISSNGTSRFERKINPSAK